MRPVHGGPGRALPEGAAGWTGAVDQQRQYHSDVGAARAEAAKATRAGLDNRPNALDAEIARILTSLPDVCAKDVNGDAGQACDAFMGAFIDFTREVEADPVGQHITDFDASVPADSDAEDLAGARDPRREPSAPARMPRHITDAPKVRFQKDTRFLTP